MLRVFRDRDGILTFRETVGETGEEIVENIPFLPITDDWMALRGQLFLMFDAMNEPLIQEDDETKYFEVEYDDMELH